MKRTVILLIATSLSALAAQETKTETPTPSGALTETRKGVDKGNAQWIEAWDRADATLIASLFADDGVMLGRSGKFFKGQKEIFERMKTVMEAAGKGVKATVTTVDLWLDGDIAYETGKYSYTSVEKGQPITDEGRYVTIWRRQRDSSWKIIMDMGVPKN
jgi:uncharacterized protein (TIGR02246 family)